MSKSSESEERCEEENPFAGVKAVIFDFDGVIVRSEPLHMETFLDVMKEYGVEVSEERWYREFAGTGSRSIIARLVKEAKKPVDKSVEELVAIRRELYAEKAKHGRLKPIDGLIEFLNFLKNKGIKAAVVSGGHKKNVVLILNLLGIYDYFEFVIGAEDVKNRKPHPEPYLIAMERLRVKPEEVLIIEDSIAGAEAARKANARFILMESPAKDRITGQLLTVKNFREVLERWSCGC